MVRSLQYFIMSFTAAFLCFSLMVMAAVLWLEPFSRPQTPPPQTAALYLPTEEDTLTLLAVGLSQDDALHTLTFLGFQPQEGRFPLAVLPGDLRLSPDGETLAELYEALSFSSFCQEVSCSFSIPVDRYAKISDENLDELLGLFCPVTVRLPKAVSYSNGDIFVSLEQGLQWLDGEKAAYLTAGSWGTEQERCFMAETIFSTAVNQKLTSPEYSPGWLFQQAVNLTDTDLSILDYQERLPALAFLTQLSQDPCQPTDLSFSTLPDGSVTLSDRELQRLAVFFAMRR